MSNLLLQQVISASNRYANLKWRALWVQPGQYKASYLQERQYCVFDRIYIMRYIMSYSEINILYRFIYLLKYRFRFFEGINNFFDAWIASKATFFYREIYLLSVRWQKIVAKGRQYYIWMTYIEFLEFKQKIAETYWFITSNLRSKIVNLVLVNRKI